MGRQRLALVLAVVASLVGAGCAGFGAETSTPAPRQSYPDPPADLTNESVRQVAIEYEETRLHNTLRNRSGVETVSVPGIHPSEATIVNRTDTGVYVEVAVSYSYSTETVEADHPLVRSVYVVGSNQVRRVTPVPE